MKRLPILSAMSAEQRKEFDNRVNNWAESGMKDVAEAVALCTSIPQATVFVQYAACYGVEKRLKEAARFLTPFITVTVTSSSEDSDPSKVSSPTPVKSSKSLPSFTTAAGTIYSFDADGNVVAVGGNRPSHFDEWIDRMPDNLREKVDTIRSNYDQMNYWRSEVERLASDPKHSETDLQRATRLAVCYEDKNLCIFAQADACWEELSGKTVSDAAKRELLQAERKIDSEIRKRSPKS